MPQARSEFSARSRLSKNTRDVSSLCTTGATSLVSHCYSYVLKLVVFIEPIPNYRGQMSQLRLRVAHRPEELKHLFRQFLILQLVDNQKQFGSFRKKHSKVF